jgi:hypothetical protein
MRFALLAFGLLKSGESCCYVASALQRLPDAKTKALAAFLGHKWLKIAVDAGV